MQTIRIIIGGFMLAFAVACAARIPTSMQAGDKAMSKVRADLLLVVLCGAGGVALIWPRRGSPNVAPQPSRTEPSFWPRPIGVVHSPRIEMRDDFWGGVEAEIELAPDFPSDSLAGLEEFSHAEVIYVFNKISSENVVVGARHPRNNPAWPQVGIFAQRAKGRPNRLGSTIVRIVGHDGRRLRVRELDAIDGTPVLDIKPVMAEFLPREPVVQPQWSHELMRDYWCSGSESPG